MEARALVGERGGGAAYDEGWGCEGEGAGEEGEDAAAGGVWMRRGEVSE